MVLIESLHHQHLWFNIGLKMFLDGLKFELGIKTNFMLQQRKTYFHVTNYKRT